MNFFAAEADHADVVPIRAQIVPGAKTVAALVRSADEVMVAPMALRPMLPGAYRLHPRAVANPIARLAAARHPLHLSLSLRFRREPRQ